MTQEAILGYSLLFLSLLCLGSWPALLRLSSVPALPSTWCGCRSVKVHRDARFSYLDYAISYTISSSVPLLMEASENGTFPPLWNPHLLMAVVGGSLLSIGNLSMQWATGLLGSPLTTVVALQASMTVLLGTSINYCLEPELTPHPLCLMAGVFSFLLAIGLATKAQLLYAKTKRQQLIKRLNSQIGVELEHQDSNDNSNSNSSSYGSMESDDSNQANTVAVPWNDEEEVNYVTVPPDTSTTTTSTSTSQSPQLALLVTVLGGCCFGFFSPAFNLAVNDPLDWGAPLPLPLANLAFSVSFTIASVVGNLPLLYKPPMGLLQPTTIQEYLTSETISQRSLAIAAGFLCGMANVLQFQGGRLVGFATADLVQAFPLVSTVWDVLLFGEFRRCCHRVRNLVGVMYLLYVCGIGLLITSAQS